MSTLVQYPQFPMNNVQLLNQNCLFGKRTFTLNGKLASDFHFGNDYMGLNTGSEQIVAPADGKCIYLTENDGTGCKTLILAHGGLFDDGSVLLTKHSHCSKFFVKVGELVKRDQPVAMEGMTGNASGNHDHTETWIVPANVWFNGKKYYSYKFSDREKYAVDPLTIYHLYPHQKAMGWGMERLLQLPDEPITESPKENNIEKAKKLLQQVIDLL